MQHSALAQHLYASPPAARRTSLEASLNNEIASFSFADTPRLSIALRAGDHGAFQFLHREWNTRIMRYCFALAAGDDAFALDIVQATYVRVFKHLGPVKTESDLWHWMARAARSSAIDLRRVGGRYRHALSRFADWIRIGAGRGNQDDLLNTLDGALALLDPDERTLIEARYFSRKPLEEIAREANTTVRAIEGRLARVRDRLRQTIATALRKATL
jgi:RNA polymerase sigma factor (sigma-70 family)